MYVDCNFVNNTAPHGHDAVWIADPSRYTSLCKLFAGVAQLHAPPRPSFYLSSEPVLLGSASNPSFQILGFSNGNLELTSSAEVLPDLRSRCNWSAAFALLQALLLAFKSINPVK
jgi:hypothetical protein